MLFVEVDDKETCRQVKHFFNKRFDHYLNLSGNRRFNLKSPIINGMPKADRNINRQDLMMLRIFHAQKIVECVSDAINECTNTVDKPYKAILIGSYFEHKTLTQIRKELGFTSHQQTKLSNLKNKALIEFAERFEGSQQRKEVEPMVKLVALF